MPAIKKSINILLTLLFFGLFLFSCLQPSNQDSNTNNKEGFNRYPSKIYYSKHAKCRMECRHIDEDEIKAIINHGTINLRKSDLTKDQCHDRYAVEGVENGQKIRIVVACCKDFVTVITCIDLQQDWPCNCE